MSTFFFFLFFYCSSTLMNFKTEMFFWNCLTYRQITLQISVVSGRTIILKPSSPKMYIPDEDPGSLRKVEIRSECSISEGRRDLHLGWLNYHNRECLEELAFFDVVNSLGASLYLTLAKWGLVAQNRRDGRAAEAGRWKLSIRRAWVRRLGPAGPWGRKVQWKRNLSCCL